MSDMNRGTGLSKADLQLWIQAGALYKTAESVAVLKDQLAVQQQALQLQQVNSALAYQANVQLSEISDSMRRLTSVQEDTQRVATASLELQQKQLDVQQQQLELHKRHYGTIDRNRDAQEVTFQMEKLLQTIAQMNDPVAKAFWAHQQLETIKRQNFSTRDLPSVEEKRAFDTAVNNLSQRIVELSPEARAMLTRYVDLMTRYDIVKRADPAQGLPPAPQQLGISVEAKSAIEHEFDDAFLAKVDQLRMETAAKRIGKPRHLIGAMVLFLLWLLPLLYGLFKLVNGGPLINWDASWQVGEVIALCLICGLVLVALYFLLCPAIGMWQHWNAKELFHVARTSDPAIQSVLLSRGVVDSTGKADEEKFTEFTKEMRTLADARRSALERVEKVKAHNKQAVIVNRQRDLKIAEVKGRIAAELQKLRAIINDFVVEHPDVLRPG